MQVRFLLRAPVATKTKNRFSAVFRLFCLRDRESEAGLLAGGRIGLYDAALHRLIDCLKSGWEKLFGSVCVLSGKRLLDRLRRAGKRILAAQIENALTRGGADGLFGRA